MNSLDMSFLVYRSGCALRTIRVRAFCMYTVVLPLRCVLPGFFFATSHQGFGRTALLGTPDGSPSRVESGARAAEASRAFDCMLKRFISQQHIGNDFMVDWYIHPCSVVTRGDRRGNHLKVYRNGEKMKKSKAKLSQNSTMDQK